MSMSENIAINEQLLNENADFLKAVVGAKTIDEAQCICAEYNVELPDDTWKEIQNSYCDGKRNSGELGEDDLNSINGGKVNGNHLLSAVGGVVGLGVVIGAGSAAGVLVACAWVGYHTYKTFR